jgi:hypothetical protein
MAIWSQRWYIVLPLVAMILGQWSLLLHGMFPGSHVYKILIDCHALGVLVKATWVEGQGCIITATDNKLLAATFIYTMTFDFIVLFLTGCKLAFPSGGRSHLVTLIFGDGLIFFFIAYVKP